MIRVHTYVIAVDAGSAPNYDKPFVTLAICKPRIRRKAHVGDVVLSFAGRRVGPEPHAVCWAGVVRELLTHGEYWNDSRFRDKRPDRTDVPDNIYKPVGDGLVWIPNTIHGCESQGHDLSGVNVLVMSPAWRFGGVGPRLPERFGLRMDGGRRGERLAELADREWADLEAWLDSQPQLKGSPSVRRRCVTRGGKRPTC
jgi:hypothetical protein